MRSAGLYQLCWTLEDAEKSEVAHNWTGGSVERGRKGVGLPSFVRSTRDYCLLGPRTTL